MAVNPVRLLENVPIPVPSLVFVLRATVGVAVMLQQTPRAVTAAPPSLVTLPPLAADVEVITEIAVVVRIGIPGLPEVVKFNWSPYAVPAELVA
jgi:hypothetical protein